MFVKFHQKSNDKLTLVPVHSIKYIVSHDDGGATICTSIPAPTPDKPKNFRSKESVEDLSKSLSKETRYIDGILSYA